MNNKTHKLMHDLYGCNIYLDIDMDVYLPDVSGGSDNTICSMLFELIKPKTAIEVGSWKGKSAIYFAQLMCEVVNPVVICVDTWLGSSEHYLSMKNDPVWGISKYLSHGKSNLYEQFLINVVHSGYENIIVPIVNTSSVAADILAAHSVIADFIYIDANHDEDEVYSDMCKYWELLRYGGVMAGDDFTASWYGVICAVSKFAKEYSVPVQVQGNTWFMQKTS